MDPNRHPDAPGWLPDTWCAKCEKFAETISYIDYSGPNHMRVRRTEVLCHGAKQPRTGAVAFE